MVMGIDNRLITRPGTNLVTKTNGEFGFTNDGQTAAERLVNQALAKRIGESSAFNARMQNEPGFADSERTRLTTKVLQNWTNDYKQTKLDQAHLFNEKDYLDQTPLGYHTLKRGLDSKGARHTVGRIDSIFRTVGNAWVALLQLGKTVIKSVVCILTLGQLHRFKLTNTWGVHGLATDGAMLLGMGYKTAIAFRDIIVAPKKGYVSAAPSLVKGLAYVFGGDYHRLVEGLPKSDQAHALLSSLLKNEPFFKITDK